MNEHFAFTTGLGLTLVIEQDGPFLGVSLRTSKFQKLATFFCTEQELGLARHGDDHQLIAGDAVLHMDSTCAARVAERFGIAIA